MSKRKTYTPEFKREAVRLMEESGRPVAEIGRELGVRPNQLYRWKESIEKHAGGAFPGTGRQVAKDDEIARLKRELEAVKEERDILKKAAAYFAKELK